MIDAGVAAFCETRLALFYLLQRAYAAPMTPEVTHDLNDALSLYGELINVELPPCEGDADEAEFNRLFVGPGRLPAPPYESVWRSEDRLLMQAAAEGVRSVYLEYGVQNTYPEPEDHLALELEFYALLQYRVLNGEAPHRHLAAQQRFWTEHLSTWVPAFCQAVEESTSSPFYRNLAVASRRILGAETTILPMLPSAIPAEEEPAHAKSV